MNVSILTVFPELYDQFLHTSLLLKAQEKDLVKFDVSSFFSYAKPKERIDAPTFGPGTGMLIKPEIIEKAVEQKEAKHGKAFKVMFSPQGKKIDQTLLQKIADKSFECGHLMLFASRYEGMDARVEQEYADEIVSLGDFVIMGGDLPAQVLLEGISRLWPGVVGKQESIQDESFSGPFLDYPEYTEPVEWHGLKVPDIVRSGNHGAIAKWRTHQAAQKTVRTHFDWLRSYDLTNEQKSIAKEYIPAHYVALMHDEIVLPNDQVGTTSVTTIDIHDIARTSATYGIKNYFIVSPLEDQQKITNMMLDFWKTGVGIGYNPQRHQAFQGVELVSKLDEAIAAISTKEGRQPLVIATSAQNATQAPTISYWQQDVVWQQDRPVLFIFGTGRGLCPQLLERCDYILLPVKGFSDFNHLSVRSAAAIILDRWMGINPKLSSL